MPIKPLALDPQDIIRRYLGGENVLAMHKATGICRNRLTRILKDAGITIRSPRERLTAWHAKATPEARMKRAEAAHAAVRGKPHTAEHRAKIAKGRQAVPSNVSRMESEILYWLRPLDAKPQWAAGPYNIDIAIPHNRIAVEVFGGEWHRSGRHAKRIGKRHEYLVGIGWRIIYLWVTTNHPLTQDGINNIPAVVADILGTHPSSSRKYWVIWGDAKGTPSRKYDPEHIARVAESKGG